MNVFVVAQEAPPDRRARPVEGREQLCREQDREGRQTEVYDQTFICWIAEWSVASGRLSLDRAASLETGPCRAPGKQAAKPHGARSGGVLSPAEPDVNPVRRMSWAGYPLAGWSPPEPASASPAEKIVYTLDRFGMPEKTPAVHAAAELRAAKYWRSMASSQRTSRRATSSVARCFGPRSHCAS